MDNAPMPFVVGLGRSGTTMLRLMLDAHPHLAVPPETGFIPRVGRLEEEGLDEEALRAKFFRIVTRHPAWPDFGMPPGAFRKTLRKIEGFDVSEGLRCFYRAYAARCGKARSGDKTPHYRAHMHLVESLMPEACFVHLIRDGRDVVLSRRGKWFERGESVAEIARIWRDEVRATRSRGRSVQRYLEVLYEDLVADPETELRRICGFVELPYDPAMLHYHEGAAERIGELGDRVARDGTVRATREQRLAVAASATRPPDLSRTGRWKHDMSQEDRGEAERVAGDLLRELGYEVA